MTLPIDDVVSMYQSGSPTTLIATHYGVSRQTVYQALKSAGVKIRPQSKGRRVQTLTRHPVELVAEVRRLAAARGVSVSEFVEQALRDACGKEK